MNSSIQIDTIAFEWSITYFEGSHVKILNNVLILSLKIDITLLNAKINVLIETSF